MSIHSRLVIVAALVVTGCGSNGTANYPPRADGCEVQFLWEDPPPSTKTIGAVTAQCDDRLSKEECERRLKDAVCRVGGDVAWGISADSAKQDGKNVWNARAAKSAAGAKAQ